MKKTIKPVSNTKRKRTMGFGCEWPQKVAGRSSGGDGRKVGRDSVCEFGPCRMVPLKKVRDCVSEGALSVYLPLASGAGHDIFLG